MAIRKKLLHHQYKACQIYIRFFPCSCVFIKCLGELLNLGLDSSSPRIVDFEKCELLKGEIMWKQANPFYCHLYVKPSV